MPLYEFKCTNKKCGAVTITLRHVGDHGDDRCGNCGSRAKYMVSAVATTFKEADKSGIKRSRS